MSEMGQNHAIADAEKSSVIVCPDTNPMAKISACKLVWAIYDEAYS